MLSDLNTGRNYYHNDVTGQTTWTKPAAMGAGGGPPSSGDGDGDAELMAALALSQQEEEQRQRGNSQSGYPGLSQGSSTVVMYQVVHPLGVGYRRSPLLSDKILDRRGPARGDAIRGVLTQRGADGLEFVKCDNGCWLPVSIWDPAKGQQVQVLQKTGGGSTAGAAGMDEEEALRLALQMSMAESSGGGGRYMAPQSQDPEDAALAAALAASLADAPGASHQGASSCLNPVEVGWVAGAPPPPQSRPSHAQPSHRPQQAAAAVTAPVAVAPPPVAPNSEHSALDAQLESSLQPILAPAFQPMAPQWAQSAKAPGALPGASQPPGREPPRSQASESVASSLPASLLEDDSSDWARPRPPAPPVMPVAPPLSRESSVDSIGMRRDSSRERILQDRAQRHEPVAQPSFMQPGANLAILQASQAARTVEQMPEQPATSYPMPSGAALQSSPYAANAIPPPAPPGSNYLAAPQAVMIPAPSAVPAPVAAPTPPPLHWQQSDTSASLESDFERTIRLIEEANRTQ